MLNLIEEVFKNTVKSYETLLSKYYPSHESKGFTERNLTFNFSHNYLLKNENALIWQECPLSKGGYIDTFIIDIKNNSLIFIEAKRLQDTKKLRSIFADYKRIKSNYNQINRIEDFNMYQKYILLLTDVWISKIKKSYDNRFKLKEQFLSTDNINNVLIVEQEINISGSECTESYHIAYRLYKI
jgi:hypothetical protein